VRTNCFEPTTILSDDLKWSRHIEAICSKAASRLHFLKLLARSGARNEDLVYFYSSIVRPILEYACPVWHSSLTVAQSDALEAIQKRAMRIVFQSMDYVTACILANIDALSSRREQLTMKFFNRCVLNPDSCIHYLLPEKRAPEIINKLRKSSQFEISQSRTVKFSKSFIPYCLSNYQWLNLYLYLFYILSSYVTSNPAVFAVRQIKYCITSSHYHSSAMLFFQTFLRWDGCGKGLFLQLKMNIKSNNNTHLLSQECWSSINKLILWWRKNWRWIAHVDQHIKYRLSK